MPNLFLSCLFIGFILILGEIAIKLIAGAILALWVIVGACVALAFLWVYIKRLFDRRKPKT